MSCILQFGVDLLDSWYLVPPDSGADDWAARLCSELDVLAENRESLRAELARIHTAIARMGNHYLSSAVFVPHPDSGEVGCVLGFEATPIPEGAGLRDFESELAASAALSRPGFRVSNVSVWRDEVDAGSVVGATMLIEHRELGEAFALVEDRRVYGVFPPGADEMVQFVFSTRNFGAFADMTAETSALVASLQVTLADQERE